MAEQVIDASVAIKWVVKGEPFRDKARQLLRDARSKGIMLIGPPLLEYEVRVYCSAVFTLDVPP